VAEGKPHDEAVQKGGDPASPGALVKRGVPSFLAAAPPVAVSAQSSGRLELARWLTRPDHPLTARVWVNRVWQHHFGRGLVDTLSNFGVRGARPSHPELLDDLADRFVASGWSNKALHRLIVTSEAYRRSSVSDASNASVDPDNRWLWRYSRRRLEAEPLRDAMLAVSGVLDRQPAGDHPFPPITAWGWTQHNAFKEVYASNHRGVYLMTQRLQRHPYLGLFDGPDANVSTDTRAVSTVPLQALYLMNNDETLRQAAALAERLAREHADSDARIVRAIQLCFGRPPAADEVARYRVYIQEFVSQSTAAGANAADAEREAWTSFARVLLTSNAFLYVD
jgi:hypothetical protein